MATNPAQPAVPQPDAHDEHSGVYGFFRRHQKKILYSAGLFTLLTFSITGPMQQLFSELFGRAPETASIEVNGKRVSLRADDYRFGEAIARNQPSLYSVMPMLDAGEGGQSSGYLNFAILRRAAIEEGIEVSMEEVDRAIEFLRNESKIASTAQFALQKGFRSLAEYREVMREAMRVGNYVRLQTLGLDGSDALVLQKLIEDEEKVTFRTAVFDEKAVEDSLKATTSVSEDDLRKWLATKSDNDKARMQAFDTNRVQMTFGALLLAEGQFDPAQWTDVLKDFAPKDDELQSNYDREKDARWKIKDGEWKPFEEVKADLVRLLQAEQVMRNLLAQLNAKFGDTTKAQNEIIVAEQQADGASQRRLREIDIQLAQKPGDAALIDEQKKLQSEAEARRTKIEAAMKAVQEARAAWDFNAAFTEATKDKSGFVLKQTATRRNADELKDLDADGFGLGQWLQSMAGTSMQNKGEIGFVPIRTTKAVALIVANDIEKQPLKAWDKLRPLAEGAYYAEKAKAKADEAKKKFEDALLRLAKAKMPEKVAELEGKKAARVDERLAEWKRTTQEGIAEAQRTLAKLQAGTQAQAAWQKKLDTLQTELESEAGKRQLFELEIGKAIENEIADEAKKHHFEVIDAAAAEAGFTVADCGPYLRKLAQRPRFDKAYDPTVVFLFRGHSELKLHEATGLQQDQTNRRWVFGVCTKVEPMTIDDVTRREFEAARTGNGQISFSSMRALLAYSQAFTHEALEKRYAVQQKVGTQTK